jgi:hypothetical protein
MDLKDKAKQVIGKVDEHLHRALCDAAEGEQVRAIVTLRAEGGETPGPEPLVPSDYPDRVAYRKALIEQRAAVLDRDVGGVKKKLEALGLTVKGGQTSPTVVVEGEAGKLLESLDLEGVGHASLDRKIELERPTEATGGGAD